VRRLSKPGSSSVSTAKSTKSTMKPALMTRHLAVTSEMVGSTLPRGESRMAESMLLSDVVWGGKEIAWQKR